MNDRKTDADVLGDSDRLNKGGDATGKEVGVNKMDGGLCVEFQTRGDEQGDNNRARVKRKDVLKGKDR